MGPSEECNEKRPLTPEAASGSRTNWQKLALVLLASITVSVTLWYALPLLNSLMTMNIAEVAPEQLQRAAHSRKNIEIIAIGDVHGDYSALLSIFQRVGIINNNRDWNGGNVTVIQTGDQQDKGSRESDVYNLLFKLQDQAPRSGGRVYILYGNHEVYVFCFLAAGILLTAVLFSKKDECGTRFLKSHSEGVP